MRYAVDLRHPLQAPCGGHDFEWRGMRGPISSRRGRGNVGIPKGFPKSVGRVGSRLFGFPCFPYSVISMACFSLRRRWVYSYSDQRNGRARKKVFVAIVVDECFGDLSPTHEQHRGSLHELVPDTDHGFIKSVHDVRIQAVLRSRISWDPCARDVRSIPSLSTTADANRASAYWWLM